MRIVSKYKHFFSNFGQKVSVGLEEVVEGFGRRKGGGGGKPLELEGKVVEE